VIILNKVRLSVLARFRMELWHVRQVRKTGRQDAHYRQIRGRVTDAQLVAGITNLIEEAQAEKTALHPELQQ
jgi:hypothetical protein